MPRPPLHNQRGFTLLEVLLAVAILATMVVGVMGVMTSSFTARNRSAQMTQTHQTANMALRRIAGELSSAFYVSDLSEELAQNREIRYRTVFDGERDEISFTTMGYMQRFTDEAAGDQAELTYRLENRRDRNGRSRGVLVRREDAPIDERPDRGGRVTVVLEDVKSIRFEYWDPDREIGDNAWVSQWDVQRDDEERLPDRVKITIEVEHPFRNRETLTYSTQAQVHLTKPLLLLPANVAEALGQAGRQQQQQIEDATGLSPSQQNNLRDAVRNAAGRR